MKIKEIYERTIKFLKIIKIHIENHETIKKSEIHAIIFKKYESLRNPIENQENHENHRKSLENHANQ